MNKYIAILLILIMSFNIAYAEDSFHQFNSFEVEVVDERIDTLLTNSITQDNISGLAFSFFTDEGIAFSYGYGYQDIEKQIQVDPTQTIFEVSSISSIVTLSGLLKLYEQGYFELNDDITDYLTNFQIKTKEDQEFTFKSLLTHTSGLDRKEFGSKLPKGSRIFLDVYLNNNMPKLVNNPGEIISYNEAAIALAALLIQEISGVPYEDYILNNIIRSVGMQNSGFILDNIFIDNLAKGYEFDSDSGDYREIIAEYESAYYPALGFKSTSHSMAMLGYSLLVDNGRLLNSDTLNMVHSTQFSYHKELAGVTLGFFEHYERGERLLISNGSSDSSHTSLLVISPESNFGFFIGANSGDNELLMNLLSKILNALYPNRRIAAIKRVSDSHGSYLEGTYQYLGSPRNNLEKLFSAFDQLEVKVVEDGIILSNMFLDNEIKAIAIGDLLYQIEETPYRITFNMEDDNPGAFYLDSLAYENLPVYKTLTFHILAMGLILLIFLLFIIGVIFAKVKSSNKRYMFTTRESNVEVFYLPVIIAAINILFVVSFGVYSYLNYSEFYSSIGTILRIILTLPIIGILLTLYAVIKLIKHIRNKRLKTSNKVVYFLITVSFIAYFILLYYWNLIGYRI